MNRRSFFRAWVLVFAMIGLASVFAPDATAQIGPPYDCTCDAIVVHGSKDLKCKVEFCVESPLGTKPNCYGVGPGSEFKIKCDKQFVMTVTDCKGITHKVTSDCKLCICVTRDCFVSFCLKQDDKGCWHLFVDPCTP